MCFNVGLVRKLEVIVEKLGIEEFLKQNQSDINTILDSFNIFELLEAIFKDVEGSIEMDTLTSLSENETVLLIFQTYLKQMNIKIHSKNQIEGYIDFSNSSEQANFNSVVLFRNDFTFETRNILLTEEQKIELSKIKDYDQNARNQLIYSLVKYAETIAKKYAFKYSTMGYEDLLQEGIIGIMKAVEKFDYKKGFKLSTYAPCWIRKGIGRYIKENSYLIRIPIHVIDDVTKLKREINRIREEFQIEPTPEEIAYQLNMDLSEVIELLKVEPEITSLDITYRDDKDSVYSYELVSPDCVEDLAFKKEMASELLECVTSFLPTRESDILIKRYGAFGHKLESQEKVGRKYGFSHTNVYKLEQKSLRTLSNNKKVKQKLRPYIISQ